jgi:hypothetical protein
MRSATDEHLGSGLSVLCILVALITKETGCKVDSERRMIEPGNRVLSISIVEDEDNDDGTTFKNRLRSAVIRALTPWTCAS